MTGKGLSPCFAGCMVAGRMRQPGRIFAGQGAAPLRRLRRHLPLQGRLLGRQPAVPGFAARVPYAVGRAFTPAGEACGGGGTAGLCKTPSHKAYESTRPPRRARSPALHCGRKRAAPRKRQSPSTPDGGPMQASAPTQGRVAAGRVRWPGRVFLRVLQGVWWPGGCGDPEGYLQGQVRHPSVAYGDTSPCRGGF